MSKYYIEHNPTLEAHPFKFLIIQNGNRHRIVAGATTQSMATLIWTMLECLPVEQKIVRLKDAEK